MFKVLVCIREQTEALEDHFFLLLLNINTIQNFFPNKHMFSIADARDYFFHKSFLCN